MLTEPTIRYRPEQAYAAIRLRVAMNEISATLPPLIQEVFAWLKKRNIAPDGPPFFNYLSIDKCDVLDVAVGVPVQDGIAGDERMVGGTFPAGSYAILIHSGPYSQLKSAHMELEAWIKGSGHREKSWGTEDGTTCWGSRIESYLNAPEEEPDPAYWQTEVAFLLAED